MVIKYAFSPESINTKVQNKLLQCILGLSMLLLYIIIMQQWCNYWRRDNVPRSVQECFFLLQMSSLYIPLHRREWVGDFGFSHVLIPGKCNPNPQTHLVSYYIQKTFYQHFHTKKDFTPCTQDISYRGLSGAQWLMLASQSFIRPWKIQMRFTNSLCARIPSITVSLHTRKHCTHSPDASLPPPPGAHELQLLPPSGQLIDDRRSVVVGAVLRGGGDSFRATVSEDWACAQRSPIRSLRRWHWLIGGVVLPCTSSCVCTSVLQLPLQWANTSACRTAMWSASTWTTRSAATIWRRPAGWVCVIATVVRWQCRFDPPQHIWIKNSSELSIVSAAARHLSVARYERSRWERVLLWVGRWSHVDRCVCARTDAAVSLRDSQVDALPQSMSSNLPPSEAYWQPAASHIPIHCDRT